MKLISVLLLTVMLSIVSAFIFGAGLMLVASHVSFLPDFGFIESVWIMLGVSILGKAFKGVDVSTN